jgi:hypothetical protein
MPLVILSKQLQSLTSDVRLGARLVLRRWKRLDRTTRGRIELTAVLSLLPLSAAIAAIAAAPSALDLDSLQSRPIVEAIVTPSISAQLQDISERREFFIREARIQRGEPIAALLVRMGIDDEAAARFLRSNPSARPLVQAAPGRFIQANVGPMAGSTGCAHSTTRKIPPSRQARGC